MWNFALQTKLFNIRVRNANRLTEAQGTLAGKKKKSMPLPHCRYQLLLKAPVDSVFCIGLS